MLGSGVGYMQIKENALLDDGETISTIAGHTTTSLQAMLHTHTTYLTLLKKKLFNWLVCGDRCPHSFLNNYYIIMNTKNILSARYVKRFGAISN